MTALDDIRQRAWDFGLTIVTVVLMATLGVQSFVGTIYVWWAERTIVGWEQTGYNGFVTIMNAIAAPQLVALVVVMGLCVPKRLFSRTALIVVSAAMVGAGVATWAVTGRIATGVTLYLALASLIQVAVVVLTAAGVRGPSYLTQGRLTKLGSGLLHLGFLIFAICISALQGSAWVLPVFGVAALLAVGGTLLSFYADRLAQHRYRVADEPQEHDFSDHPTVSEPDASLANEELAEARTDAAEDEEPTSPD